MCIKFTQHVTDSPELRNETFLPLLFEGWMAHCEEYLLEVLTFAEGEEEEAIMGYF